MVEEDEEELEFTPEEKAAREHINRLYDRFPTFVLLRRTLDAHRRYRRMKQLGVPSVLMEQFEDARDKALDRLCEAFPLMSDETMYDLEDVLGTLIRELKHHPKCGAKEDS